jgi:hypothetical protein
MRLSAIVLGTALLISPATGAPAPGDSCYYYHGYHYPYYWHGHYYRYHWHGHYYRYHWHGHYYNHRHHCSGGWCYR